MPVTNSGVRIYDPILSAVAQGVSIQELVGSALFPRVPVGARGGQIIEFERDAFRLYASKRAPGSRTARIQFGYAGKPFALVNDSLEVPLPREHLQDASVVPGIDMGRRATNVAMSNMLLSLEVDQAAIACNAALYGAANKVALAGATKWTAATGQPLTDMDAAREAIRQACGKYPNVMLMSAVAFNACRNNVNIIERFKYNGAAGTVASMITPQMLAGLFNVDKVVVGAGIYWSDANAPIDIWGNNVVLAVVPNGRELSLEEPSYGYTYTLNNNPLVEVPYYENSAKSWIYGVTFERAPVLAGLSAGYLIQSPA